MTTQRVSSVKISMFDKDNYGLWKKNDDLFSSSGKPKVSQCTEEWSQNSNDY